MSYHLEKRWKKLYNSSLIRTQSLKPIKKKFADMTAKEINIFCNDVSSNSIVLDIRRILYMRWCEKENVGARAGVCVLCDLICCGRDNGDDVLCLMATGQLYRSAQKQKQKQI